MDSALSATPLAAAAIAADRVDIEVLDRELARLPLAQRLLKAASLGRAVFTTSLGLEDQVLTAAIAEAGADIAILTLETGRLFAETLALLEETRARYGVVIEAVRPWREEVDGYVAQHGLNGFYESVEARHACCDIRKMRPLARALSGADVWVTGLRRGQSATRANAAFAEWDPVRQLVKINPLADFDLESLEAQVRRDAVPVNPLHKRGYPSIGCQPCTRAIKPGEPERAGRWWWEDDQKRECGLHVASASSQITN